LNTRNTVYFTMPGQVEVRSENLPELTSDQVLVETLCSAISPGTEMLVYRGQFPRDLPVDACFPGMDGGFAYPLAYGYACVGRVVDLGDQVEKAWQNRLVFSFQPHTSRFITHPDDLLIVPDGLPPQAACFLPNIETAVNLVQDAAPILGERVLVFGQGIVGLLTAALLAEFPLETLVTVDCYPRRREVSLALGAAASLDPLSDDFRPAVRELLPDGADLTIELSGAPAALEDAIALTTFSGRVMVGSWYGEKKVQLDLGGSFHRSRIRLISSQVSSIAPDLSGRWDKSRRFQVCWEAIRRIRPEKWITHHFPFEQAAQAYQLLDEKPEETIQIVLKRG
jgi:2-desacetyl-2-hydroxyethyl bacteriochlorophyllide A dehydrogenase